VPMLMALRERSIALLWSGQALSATGDEIYRVTLIWLAVGLIGEDAGYLAAAQASACAWDWASSRWARRAWPSTPNPRENRRRGALLA
jgi:hypothetical protein